MIDDLQTLCASALRRHYLSANNNNNNNNNSPQRCESPTLIDSRLFDALAECSLMNDRPLLQIEAVWALVDAFERLTPEQRKDVAARTLVDLRVSPDADVRQKAGVALGDIVNGPSEARRSLVLGPLVRGVLGADSTAHADVTKCFGRLLSIDKDPPIQRIIDGGVVPRFVAFLRRDDDPVLQRVAVKALARVVVRGTPDHAKVVVRDAGAVVEWVRLLRSPDDDVKARAARGIADVAGTSCELRDSVLQNQAMAALIAGLHHARAPKAVRILTWTLYAISRGKPRPDFALVRAALPTWSSLVHRTEEEVLGPACHALCSLTYGPSQQIDAVIEAGVCGRFVELLQHPTRKVQRLAVHAIANIVAGNARQARAVLNHDPLPSLRDLLASPDEKIRGIACQAVLPIVKGSQRRIQEVVDQDLIPCVIRCLADAAPAVRRRAARVVRTITSKGTTQRTLLLAQRGCVRALCDLLESDLASETAEVALTAITNILRAGEDRSGPEAFANPMSALVLEAGGVTKLKSLRQRPYAGAKIRKSAGHLVRTYFGEQGAATLPAPASSGTGGGEEGGGDEMEPPGKRPRLS